MREGNQQFGSWLHAATPNIAKKTIVRVAGYKDEVNGEPACNPSPRSNGEGEWFKPQPKVGREGDKKQQFPVAMGDHVMQETTSEVRTDEEGGSVGMCTTSCPNVNQPEASSNRNFQDQLDEIDGELTRYEDMGEETKGELAVLQSWVGFQVVRSTFFLKNFFSRSKLGSKASKISGFTRIARKLGLSYDPLEPVVAKRMRKEFEEDSKEENG